MRSSAAVEMVGARIRVRELLPRDVDTLVELAEDAEVVRFVSWPARSREALTDFVARSIEAGRASPRTAYALAVEDRTNGETLGFTRLMVTSVEHEQAELGVYLLRRHWGKGIATELAALMRDFALCELRVHRLFCHCDTENAASMHVLEKLGFVREGTIRHRVRIDGVWRDSHLYAMLSP